MAEKQFLQLADKLRPHVKEIDVKTVRQMQLDEEDFVLIDVRELSEWVAGHLPQAIHLSKGLIECKIENTVADKSKKIVLYCGSGYRSLLAAYNVSLIGYPNVISMQGGVNAWLRANFPLDDDVSQLY